MLRDVMRCQRGHCLLRDVSAVRGYTLSHRIIIKMIMGIRVSEEEELAGLDSSEVGISAYPEFDK